MADIGPTYSQFEAPDRRVEDYQHIPQRSHVYPSSDRAQRIVHESMAMDSRFSAVAQPVVQSGGTDGLRSRQREATPMDQTTPATRSS